MSNAVVSSDSHVLEPADLWVTRIERKYRDNAPRVAKRTGGYFFVAPGIKAFPVGAMHSTGKGGKELREIQEKGSLQDARAGGWDPAARIKDMETDGLRAEVLYTTMGLMLFSVPDFEFQAASFRAFNDWLAEFASYAPKRFYAIGMIPLGDIKAGVAEMQRIAKLGVRGAMIWSNPGPDAPFNLPMYNDLWAASQDLQMPVSLHVGTSKTGLRGSPDEPYKVGGFEFMAGCMGSVQSVQNAVAQMIFGRVFDRYPGLKVVSVEQGTGWVPNYVTRLDHAWKKWGLSQEENQLDLGNPSEYIKRNVGFTFEDDMIGPQHCDLIGEDSYMWASDFPHSQTTWPNSLKIIEKNFAGIPERITRKIICDNAAKMYRMDLN